MSNQKSKATAIPNRGLHRLALLLACATVVLLVAGALVTSNEAGDSVPDWPVSFGRWLISSNNFVANVRFEYSHRMIAGIDVSTGLPHIYQHNVAEHEVEDILCGPLQDIRGWGDSRIAIGQTSAGRDLRVIYVPDPVPDSLFVITAYELGPKAKRAIRRRKRKKR